MLCACFQGANVAVVFCGDLNSDPRYGTVEFITNGTISENHADWYCGMCRIFKNLNSCVFPGNQSNSKLV